MAQRGKLPVPDWSASPAALLLPAMSLNTSVFPDLPVATLAPDFNRRLPDGAPRRGGTRMMTAYADAVDRLLTAGSWADAGPRIVVGHSFGGMLALAWWLRHGGRGPGRIDGLLLIATTAGPMFDVVRLRLARFGGRDVRIGISGLMGLWNSRVVTKGVDRILSGGRVGEVDFRELAHLSDLRVGLAGWRGTAWEARRGYRLAMEGFDVRRDLHTIDVPTIVLAGSEDHLFLPQVAEALATGIPGAELRVVRGAGHALPLTHGGEAVRAVRDLL